jgi:hypothetical protein
MLVDMLAGSASAQLDRRRLLKSREATIAQAETAQADAVLINLNNNDFTSRDKANKHYNSSHNTFNKDLSLKGTGARLGHSAVG